MMLKKQDIRSTSWNWAIVLEKTSILSIRFRLQKVFFGANKKVQLFLDEKSRIEALTHCTLMLSPDSEIDNIAKTRSARVRGTAVTVTDARRQLVLLCGAPIENVKKLYVVNERV
jgi:hypothetical protein